MKIFLTFLNNKYIIKCLNISKKIYKIYKI